MALWFRLYVGTTQDPRFKEIGKRTGLPAAAVLGVWLAMMERACEVKPRGQIAGIDPESLSISLQIPEQDIVRVLEEFQGVFLNGTRVIKWSRYEQPDYVRCQTSEWVSLRKRVIKRYGRVCVYCGQESQRIEVDHVIPVARGGLDEMDNLVTACRPCNRSKGAKTIQEWLGVEA